MDEDGDILVIGAGVAGLASALSLLERGRSVRVVDAGRVGGGSSHGNCGTLTPSHAGPLHAPGMVAKALRWMLRQYGGPLRRMAEDLGTWDCVGLTLGDMLQEIEAEKA